MIKSCRYCENAVARNVTGYVGSDTVDESYLCNEKHSITGDDPKCKYFKLRRCCRTCRYLDMVMIDEQYTPRVAPWETYECQKENEEHTDKPTCSLWEESPCQ